MLARPGNENLRSVNPVVGETNDGFLSDIRSRPVTPEHVLAALAGARSGPVAQGCVGAGAGTAALGFKAGIGTASRQVPLPDGDGGVVGALVQSNFSGTLTVRGIRIDAWRALRAAAAAAATATAAGTGTGTGTGTGQSSEPRPDGNSAMIIVATDLALDARQLGRVAKRAVFALGGTGSDFAPGSGDYAIAFATGAAGPLADAALGPVFGATAEAVTEAILDSLFLARTTTGYRGHVRHAVPADYVLATCQAAGVA